VTGRAMAPVTIGTRLYSKPPGWVPGGAAGATQHTGPKVRDGLDPADTDYVTDQGLQCRPGNVVVIAGEQLAVNPDWWFPAPSDFKTIARAKSLCRRCPARHRCLDVGITTTRQYGGYGIWGGQMFEESESRRSRKPQRPDPAALYDEQGRRVL
jgi:Transcription factor WhiB